MSVIKELTMYETPDGCDFKNGYVYDGMRFRDTEGNCYYYESVNCTSSGTPHKNRSKLLEWATAHNNGDKVTVNATFENGIIIRPRIVNHKEKT